MTYAGFGANIAQIVVGQMYGTRTVLGETSSRKNGTRQWECRCICGRLQKRDAHEILNPQGQNCPRCRNRSRRKTDAPSFGSSEPTRTTLTNGDLCGRSRTREQRCCSLPRVITAELVREISVGLLRLQRPTLIPTEASTTQDSTAKITPRATRPGTSSHAAARATGRRGRSPMQSSSSGSTSLSNFAPGLV